VNLTCCDRPMNPMRLRDEMWCDTCGKSVGGIEVLARQARVAGTSPSSLTIGQSFALSGSWRVYFNRDGAADKPWCVSPVDGRWEVCVNSVGISAVAETVYQPKATADSDDGKPSAWIAVDGCLTVHASGHATIGDA
jgi:hypothetical protein